MPNSTWKRVSFDLESNGLFDIPAKDRVIWCLGLADADTEEYRVYMGDNLLEGVQILADAELIIAHNGIGFDIPWIKSVTGVDVAAKGTVWDTAIVSRLYKPDIVGGHSLSMWGKRLGFHKMDYRGALIETGAMDGTEPRGHEFTFFHPLMLEYVQRDVEVCHKLFRAGLSFGAKDGWGATGEEQMNGMAFKIEHASQRVMFNQEQTGWLFNSSKAEHTIYRMNQAVAAIDRRLDTLIPPLVETKGVPITEPFTKAGKYKKTVIDWWGDDVNLVGGGFCRLIVRQPSYDSQAQLKAALTKLGWRSNDFTDGGSPRLTEESLEAWGGKTGTMVGKRLMYKHRLGLVSGLLSHVREDGRVAAGGICQGAVTGRVTHRVVANIPRISSPMGKQIRSLFCAPEGKVLIGCDAAGLELRCLAHYVNSEEISDVILNGDIHQKNADAVGVDRDTVKTLTYGWLYGAGDAKLGKTALDSKVGQWAGTEKEGTVIRSKFLKSMNAEKLMEQVANKAEQGWIKGIDGRIIPIRAAHSALNTLLQSAGAIVMKLAYIKLASWLDADPTRGRLLCFYHDEYTVECGPEQAEQTGKVMARCIVWAGEQLGFRVPLAGDPQVGAHWGAIH